MLVKAYRVQERTVTQFSAASRAPTRYKVLVLTGLGLDYRRFTANDLFCGGWLNPARRRIKKRYQGINWYSDDLYWGPLLSRKGSGWSQNGAAAACCIIWICCCAHSSMMTMLSLAVCNERRQLWWVHSQTFYACKVESVAYNIKEFFFFLISVMGRSSSDEERVFDERRCRSQSFSANEFNIISGSRQRERGTQLR